VYLLHLPCPKLDGTPLVQTADIGWQASALMNGLGSHCCSRSGSSRDDEVPGAWLVVVAIPLLVSYWRASEYGRRAEYSGPPVMFPDRQSLLTQR